MNQDIDSTAKTFRRHCKLHLAHSTKQANSIPPVQIGDSVVQARVQVSLSKSDRKNVNISKWDSEHGTRQDDHNLILQNGSLSTGVNQTACASQVASDWHLYPRALAITSDTRDHESHTWRDLTAHSNPRYQRVQCSPSDITGELNRELSGFDSSLGRLHVSSCSGINTFELFSSNILPNQCSLDFDKTAETVHNKHRLYGFCTEAQCPVYHQTPAESPTHHFDLTADLQYNTSFSNFDIYRSSKIPNESGDNSSDETLKYRNDIRKQCKRHHHLKPYTADKRDTYIRNTFVLKDIDNLGFPSYVLTPQGTNKHSGNVHPRTHKNRHRQKHEIGKNHLSGNKATTLRFNSCETGDGCRPGPQNKDFSKSLNSKLCLFPTLVSNHKESPRARFERDRAARNNAISRNSFSIQDSIPVFCSEQPTSELETIRHTTTEKCPEVDIQSAPKQQSKFEKVYSRVNECKHVNNKSSGLQFSLTDNNPLAGTISHLRQFISQTSINDRLHQSTLTSKAEFLDQRKKSVVDVVLPVELTHCSVPQNTSLPTPAFTNEEDWRDTDETVEGDGERVNTSWPDSTVVQSHAYLSQHEVANKNCSAGHKASGVQVVTRHTETRVNFNSVLYSKDRNKRDHLTSNNTGKHQLEPQRLPISLNKRHQVRPADSSSSPLEYNFSSSVVDDHTYQKSNSSEINGNLPVTDLRHQRPLGFEPDFNRVESFGSNVDTSVIHRELTIVNNGSTTGDKLNRNIESHNQPRSLTSNVRHRLSDNVTEVTLNKLTQLTKNVFNEKNTTSSQACNYNTKVNQLHLATRATETNKLSVTDQVTFNCDSASSNNSCFGRFWPENYTRMSDQPISPSASQQCTNFTENSPVIGGYRCCARINTSSKRMLASKGLRIYDYIHDFNGLLNPAKSPNLKSPVSTFQWEGTTYLILPTVLDSLTANNTRHVSTIGKRELLTQRSVSDSGAVMHSFVNTNDVSNNLFASCNDKDITNEDSLLSPSSRNRRLSFKQRSLSVDVLCAADDDSNFGFGSVLTDSHNISEDNINAGRGYVEWKTCSSWLQKPEVETMPGNDTRGYVEWDTIWTPSSTRVGEGKDDEHLYDSVGDYNSYSSSENVTDLPCDALHSLAVNSETPYSEDFQNLPVTTETPSSEEIRSLDIAETPPALPERTYISRLKKCNSAELPPSCLEIQKSIQHHRHHHHHHDISNLRKYHNHHHRHPTSNNKHQQHLSATSSTPASVTTSTKYSSSVLFKQCKHTSGSSESSLRSEALNQNFNASNEIQNYATVHKLKGYRFNNITTASERLPHPQNKQVASSENYCHLAPLASKQSMISLQTGDILDYIDGLHDSMSPKSRENIYILLNNKQTRAKFSESLEIESRLLSKGLISGSSASETLEDTLLDKRSVGSGTTQSVFNFKVPKRKEVSAPVSSTYV